MNKTQEALKLALEVMHNQGDVSVDEWIATEKAIREALAEHPERYATTIGEGNLSENGFEGDWFKQPAQQQYQSTADKCELTPVPAKGGLLLAQQQEPVAFEAREIGEGDWFRVSLKDVNRIAGIIESAHMDYKWIYITPPQQQEPVGYVRPEVLADLKRGVRWGAARLSPRADEEDGLTAPIYISPQPAQQQEPVAKVVSTAPKRIWLDLGFDPEVEDEISFDDLFEATWSHDNATGNGIEYVRADLAPASKPWVGLTEEEVDECYYWKDRQWTTDELVRHVEAKLREKNQ